MKIERIELYQLDLPYSGGVYHLSGGRTYASFDATFTRIVTDVGIDGWGESTPFGATYIAAHALGARAGIKEMAPHLIGMDPREVDRINDVMDGALVGHNHAKTPLDVACWDIFGKSVNMPVCALLGGSTGDVMPVISSIHAGDPADMRNRVAAHRARGYRGHSIKIGDVDPALDSERIKACLADRQPGEFFQADANGGMLVEQVIRLLNLLPSDIDLVLEAPCASWRETQSLRAKCRLPIMMDELAQQDQDIAHIIAEDLADGIGLKVSKAGGLTPGRRQRDICRSAGLTMSVQDTVGSTIAFAALAHLGQTVPAKNLRCILDCRDMVSVETAQFDAPIQNGGVLAPNKPGLGIEVDRKILGSPIETFS